MWSGDSIEILFQENGNGDQIMAGDDAVGCGVANNEITHGGDVQGSGPGDTTGGDGGGAGGIDVDVLSPLIDVPTTPQPG